MCIRSIYYSSIFVLIHKTNDLHIMTLSSGFYFLLEFTFMLYLFLFALLSLSPFKRTWSFTSALFGRGSCGRVLVRVEALRLTLVCLFRLTCDKMRPRAEPGGRPVSLSLYVGHGHDDDVVSLFNIQPTSQPECPLLILHSSPVCFAGFQVFWSSSSWVTNLILWRRNKLNAGVWSYWV